GRVGDERAADARGEMAGEPRAERQAADEYDEHHRLRVSGVPEEELEVVTPDGLVDEPAEAGDREQREQRADACFHFSPKKNGGLAAPALRAASRPLASSVSGRSPGRTWRCRRTCTSRPRSRRRRRPRCPPCLCSASS